MSKPQTGGGKAPPKRPELRSEADRAEASTRLCVRLPVATARQLERLAEARHNHRVTVLCELIDAAATVQKGKP